MSGCVISCVGDTTVMDEPEIAIEVISTGDPRHMKVERKLITLTLLMGTIQIPREEEEEESDGEEKRKCVDIKLSLRCRSTGKQLCDVTVYVAVDVPVSAHLSTRSFSIVGEYADIITCMHMHIIMHRFCSSGDLSHIGLLIELTTC